MSHLRELLPGLIVTLVGVLTSQVSRAEGLIETLPKTET